MKKKLAFILAAAMSLSLLGGCIKTPPAADPVPPAASSSADQSAGSSADASSSADVSGEEIPTINVMVLSGPTGVGAAQMMTTHVLNSSPEVFYDFKVAAENPEVTSALINGDADIAAVATNVAANLVNKTDGGIQVLAINTLGVLYVLEKGDSVHSMGDLRGKTVYAPSTAKGANPEYIFNHLLLENDVDPSQVTMEWMTPQEITAKMASSEEGICLLPVPAATALLVKDAGVREAISLSDEWDKLGQGALAQGCVVARTDFVEEHPELVESFLEEYSESIFYMMDITNVAETASMVAALGIAPNETIAAAAIPQCNLTYITGQEMKDILEQFFSVMYQADPSSIGGAMPFDSFYYGAE